MTPQEREVIDGIFNRLKPAAAQDRDPEAERYITGLLTQQPYAPYVLAQSVYVQEQALNNLQQENEQLKAQLAELQRAQQAAPQPQSGGFLSGLFGGGAAQRPAAPPPPPPQASRSPWGAAPQQMGMQPQAAPQGGPWGGAPQAAAPAAGGGFLSSALTTAAGVAGGMVVGNMLMNAFKGSGSGSNPAHAASSDFQPTGQSGGQQHLASQNQGPPDQGYDEEEDNGDDAGYDGGYDGGGGDTYEA